MRIISFFLFAFIFFNLNSLSADSDNFCSKCDKFRDYHKKNPSKYEFYEDYLKDVDEGLVDPNEKPTVYDFLPNDEDLQ